MKKIKLFKFLCVAVITVLSFQNTVMGQGNTNSDWKSYHDRYTIMMNEGKKDEALKIIMDAYTNYPKEEIILYDVINFYVGEKVFDKAEIYLNEAIQQYPENLSTLLSVKGGMYVERYIKIKDNYQKANNEAKYSEANAFRSEFNTQVKKAEDAFNQILSKDSKNYNAYFNLGLISYDKSDMTNNEAEKEDAIRKAIDYFKMANEIQPTNRDVLNNLRLLHIKLGEFEKAKYYKEKIDALDNSSDDNNPSANEDLDQGLKAVDLGLPSGTLWANRNVGADNTCDCGVYFAYGELQGKKNYSWDTYKYANGARLTLKKYTDNEDIQRLDPKLDAASVIMRDNWRTPTREDFIELMEYCDMKIERNYKNTGIRVLIVYNRNDRSKYIVIPGCGFIKGSTLYNSSMYKNGHIKLWSSSTDLKYRSNQAFYFSADDGNSGGGKAYGNIMESDYYIGMVIRAVIKK